MIVNKNPRTHWSIDSIFSLSYKQWLWLLYWKKYATIVEDNLIILEIMTITENKTSKSWKTYKH